MKRMNKNMRKTMVLFLALLGFAFVVYGAIIWTKTTVVRIEEPFNIESNLPAELVLYPGNKEGPYYIKVTNNGKGEYTAILYYNVNASQGVKFTITPDSGTSKDIKPGVTDSFEIYIEIHGDSASGTLTIDWWIERES